MWLMDNEDKNISAETLEGLGFKQGVFDDGEPYWWIDIGIEYSNFYDSIIFYELPTVTYFFEEVYRQFKHRIDVEWKEKILGRII